MRELTIEVNQMGDKWYICRGVPGDDESFKYLGIDDLWHDTMRCGTGHYFESQADATDHLENFCRRHRISDEH